jgi:thiol-disulfide isomerase/thioredoxin
LKKGIRRAVTALLFAFSAGSTPAASPSRVAGELDAPGLTRMLAGQKGRVVLLNFWATWCVPCREEFPDLSKLQNRNRAAGFQLIGISTDFAKQRAAVDAFIAEQRPAFPNYWKKSGDDEAFIEAVDSKWGGELPFSVLFDRSGRKVRVYSGSLPVAAAEKEIRRLLASR